MFCKNDIANGTTWGEWRLKTRNLTLICAEHNYEINLEDMNHIEMLDWIFQIRGKSWANNNTVGNLVTAFQDLFDPQATLYKLANVHN